MEKKQKKKQKKKQNVQDEEKGNEKKKKKEEEESVLGGIFDVTAQVTPVPVGLELSQLGVTAYDAQQMECTIREQMVQALSQLHPAEQGQKGKKRKEVGADPFEDALDAAEEERKLLVSTGKTTPFDNRHTTTTTTTTATSSTSPSSTSTSTTPRQPTQGTQRERVESKASQASNFLLQPQKRRKRTAMKENWLDDGDDTLYAKRVSLLQEDLVDGGEEEEFTCFEGGFKLPSSTYSALFEYQRTGVKWMWELHCQGVGGIIGDEMGLGKTIQTICFLGGLLESNFLEGGVLIVCPATLMHQWVDELHNWCPTFRVALLHESGSFEGPKKTLIRKLASPKGVLLTTYEALKIHQKHLLKSNWEYLILDEGHKIRNPDSDITLVCKKIPTPHRLILSGAPIQNNLTELWSLFDFVFPGKLGTLPTFQAEFAIPITIGGYSNASSIQVQTAYRCAVALRDLINPYLLRRLRNDVLQHLPRQHEQVLFCHLTDEQKEIYRNFLKSNEVAAILSGKRNALYGIDILRKICNHPDLLSRLDPDRPLDYGNWERSGKLKVVERLLPLWKEQGHKVLLFAQTRQMLDILELFVESQGFTYNRLDGNTDIGQRMSFVNEFNSTNSEEKFLFLLSTKVGGLGLNLIGASRIIIFDPDWNPSTDIQARERACRIGQTQEVTVYRLMTAGTLEEKIYHRQIFKQFLTDKILKNPQQKRFFKFKHLRDLFTFTEKGTTDTEHILDLNFTESKDEILTTSNTDSTGGEASILQQLFDSRAGLTSIVDHSRLLGHSTNDFQIVEAEASKIAQQAVKALKESRLQCEADAQHTWKPTWTGRSGSIGRKFGASVPQTKLNSSPGSFRPSRPPSSAELLANMGANKENLAGDLHDFLQNQGGEAPTDAIVQHFKQKISTEDLLVFRSILKQIASFDKETKHWKVTKL